MQQYEYWGKFGYQCNSRRNLPGAHVLLECLDAQHHQGLLHLRAELAGQIQQVCVCTGSQKLQL